LEEEAPFCTASSLFRNRQAAESQGTMEFTLDKMVYRYASGGNFTLGPLSLTITSNGVTALIGSNGSGKTTLIKVLLGEFTGFEGGFSIDGAAVLDHTGSLLHRYGIGYAPEFPVLEERLTGFEIMHLLNDIHQVSDADFTAQIEECRTAFHLGSWFEEAPCREYSQGMRKKVSLMIALIGAPRFIIIDEPTNGLDPIAVFGLKKILAKRVQDGCGALVSSHMLDFVERIARDVVILKQGAPAYAGTVADLLLQHPGKRLDEIYYHLFTSDIP
jgi:ABC-2 type transport system ATP-binding protein